MADVTSCGVLIFRSDPNRSFLLMRHPKRWDLPKGHVDKGETELECALRELWEETGITAKDIELDPDFRFLLQYTVRYKRHGNVPKQKDLIIFLAELKNDVEIVPTEHKGFEWFEWQPPHSIQEETIDPLLSSVAEHWSESS